MNDLNQLEKQLAYWTPRRPSARLKRQLFGAPCQPASEPSDFVAIMPVWVKFAPVLCMLLLITLFCVPHHSRASYLAVSSGSNLLASLSSNIADNCATDFRAQRQNVWQAVTFDWTKDGHSISTTGSFLSGRTNLQKL